MPAASFASVRSSLERGKLVPVYYLTGDEEVLKDELVDAIVDSAVDPSNRDFNLDVRSAADLDGESFHALVETPPLLAERRAAVVRNLEQWRKNSKVWRVVEGYVSQPSTSTVLVLVHGAGQAPDKTLTANALHVSVPAPEHDLVREWVLRRGKQLQIEIEPDAVDHLIKATGASLSELAMELEKLASAVGNESIGVEEIESFVGVRHGETMPDWVDAVLARDNLRAISLLNIVLPRSGVTGVRMLMGLGTAFAGSRLSRALSDRGIPPRQMERQLLEYVKRTRPAGLGSHKAEVGRWIAASRKWTGGELENALRLVYEADQQLKSTTISDARSTLYTLLLRLNARRETA
jgi:DNA polymerase-3 subunit delta